MKLTPIQEIEAAIRDRPADAELYLQLVPLYVEKGRDYEAERLLARAALAKDDSRLKFAREELTMARLARSVAVAQQHADAHATPESRAVLKQALDERDQTELEIFADRSEREPENAGMRHEWGLRLKRAGKLEQAAQRFEEALTDAQQRPAAALELGECQRQFENIPEALRYYRLAAESAELPDQQETKKRALWQAIGLTQRIKLTKLSQRYLSELARIDPKYVG